MKRFARLLPFVAVVIVVLFTAYWLHAHRESIVSIGPGVCLSWNANRWAVLDDRAQPYVGFEEDLVLGGATIADDVVGLAKAGEYLVGKTRRGEYFVIRMAKLQRGENPNDTIWILKSERAWRDVITSLGLDVPTLLNPSALETQ